jgi:hypothetical protein
MARPKSTAYFFSHILAIYTEGVAPPTYYFSRNTQMPEEKPWNENKVLQLSNTDFHRQKEFFLDSLFPSCPSCPSWFTYFDGGFRKALRATEGFFK